MFVKNEIVKVDVIVCEYANDDERHPQSLVLEHCEVPLQQHSVKWANHLRYVSTTVNQAAMRADAMAERGGVEGVYEGSFFRDSHPSSRIRTGQM